MRDGMSRARGRTRAAAGAAIAAIGLAGLASGCAVPGEPAQSGAGEAGRSVRVAAPAAAGPPYRATTRTGLYRIAISPEDGAIALGALQAWRVEVRSAAGDPVALSQLAFDGGMPQHGHGFETSPRPTDVLGDGIVRVDGVRFHMSGRWSVRVAVAGPLGVDVADFEIDVGP